MKAGKVIIILAISLMISGAAFSQNHEEQAFPYDKVDPAKSIQLYPNPATEVLNVRFEMPLAKRIKITVHNIIGNVLDIDAEIVDEHELQLKVRELPSGFYLLSVKDPDSGFKSTYKFLKR